MVKFLAPLFACALMLGCGCRTNDTKVENVAQKDGSNTYVVIVGMENSRFAGSCPGAKYDAQRMNNLLTQYTSNVKTFYDAAATHDAVANAIKDGISKADLFILFYSGHGGSQKFNDTGAEEVDNSDEFLCLYDTYMRDNEIWNMITKASGRVLLMFDCCHSETMFRTVKPFNFSACIPMGTTHTLTGTMQMQCWSGCPDNTYSYGSSSGGKFTNTFLKYFKSNATYEYIWNEIENDASLKNYEQVQRTVIGNGFDAKLIFR